jgi:predicted exporter
MSTQYFSLILAGSIWLLVALRIGSRAFEWLSPYVTHPSWQIALLPIAIILGVLKAKTVLKKAANRNIGNLTKVKNEPGYYLHGWLVLYGVPGTITISLMIAMGIGLRALRAAGNDPLNIFGFIYLAVAIGLGLSALYYFEAARKQGRSESK